MKDAKSIRSEEFTYALPEDRIAKFPLEKRDHSKLLSYKNGKIEDQRFTELPSLLEPGDLLVFNRTRVIHARLLFEKTTGGIIEIFCLEPFDQPDPALALQQRGTAVWKVLVGNLKRWKEPVLKMQANGAKDDFGLTAEITGKQDDAILVLFRWSNEKTFAEVIEELGRLPIPPYLGRDAEDSDELRYQTVYADREGSVAAPTAGLHFTDRIFSSLEKSGIKKSFVTLHVGAGTFRPLKSETIGEHNMHEERISVEKETVTELIGQLKQGKRIIAVGTTSMRTIESLYWLGKSILEGRAATFVEQWAPYDSTGKEMSVLESLEGLEAYMTVRNQQEFQATTRIMIVPGYSFKLVDALITNFHQPSSTLLLLVAAFVGDDWKSIYQHALDREYRFLSYGDSSFLTRLI